MECYNDESPEACINCIKLRSNHIFQNALNRAMPSDDHFKYTPKGYRGGPESEVYLKYEGVRELVENLKVHHHLPGRRTSVLTSRNRRTLVEFGSGLSRAVPMGRTSTLASPSA